MAILELVIGAVIGFVVGIFVYRNNTDVFGPFAKKIDDRVDEIKRKLEDLETKIDDKDELPRL